ncbi:MAG: hypothetical protein GF355_01625, partial [Candidatus Eisenbacteria bacterium]|nr:hypothetical protein [Candidatus Eisenbacteria bacterium]
MTCRHGAREYVDYLLGEMEAARRSRFDRHAAQCSRCRAELEVYSTLVRGLQALPDREPPADLTASIMTAVQIRPEADLRRRESPWRRVFQIVAAQALVLSFLLAVRPMSARTAGIAWEMLSGAWAEVLNVGRDALVVLVSFSKILDIGAGIARGVG